MTPVPKHRFQISLLDNKGKLAQFSLPTQHALSEDEMASFKEAISGLSDGLVREYGTQTLYVEEDAHFSPEKRSDARRRWRISYRDKVSLKTYTFTMPTADVMKRKEHLPELDLTSEAGKAFKAAFEKYVISPDGNPVEILSAKYDIVS